MATNLIRDKEYLAGYRRRGEGYRVPKGEITMKQRLRDDKKHGVSGATLSARMWSGHQDKKAREGGCRLQILWVM